MTTIDKLEDIFDELIDREEYMLAQEIKERIEEINEEAKNKVNNLFDKDYNYYLTTDYNATTN